MAKGSKVPGSNSNLVSIDQETRVLLETSGLTLAVAESVTGGKISDAITNTSGSSGYFLGGVIAYDNHVKTQLLGVSEGVLEKYGAVSARAAEVMADGVRLLLGADLGLSVTGIAGPSGATQDKPVGLAFLGMSWDRGLVSRRVGHKGGRLANKESFAKLAIALLREGLESLSRGENGNDLHLRFREVENNT